MSQTHSRRQFTAQIVGAALLAQGASAFAQAPAGSLPPVKTPAELNAFGGSAPWRLQGSGTLRFFGFKAYDASLWTVAAASAPVLSSSNPFAARALYALEIVYNTGIKADEIVKVSLEEMARLRRLTDAQNKAWKTEMQRAFPSVAKGDRLTGLHVPNVGTQFYFNARLILEITDPAFGDAFFAIWLDEGTQRPELRKLLLGQALLPSGSAVTK